MNKRHLSPARSAYWNAQDGACLFYRQYGDADAASTHTVVMLHSLFFDGSMFDQALPYLPPGLRLICPDHRGQGQSESGEKRPSMAQLAEDIAKLIAHVANGPVHIVGSSMGGYVALALAAKHPELLRTCVLSCCTAQAESQPERFAALEQALRDQGAGSMVDRLLRTMFGDDFLVQESPALARWRQHFQALDTRIADAVSGVFSRPSYEANLPALHLPMLLISGGQDQAKRPQDMQNISDHVAQATHRCIDTAGHTPPVETPEVYGKALSAFWQQNI